MIFLRVGDIVRQALDAALINALTVTIVPVVLGSGCPLFAGATRRQALTVTGNRMTRGLVQLDLAPASRGP